MGPLGALHIAALIFVLLILASASSAVKSDEEELAEREKEKAEHAIESNKLASAEAVDPFLRRLAYKAKMKEGIESIRKGIRKRKRIHSRKKRRKKELQGLLQMTSSEEATSSTAEFCWRESYPRGAGRAPNTCPESMEIIAGGVYCYNKCEVYGDFSRFGYDCHQNCPSDWEDHGLLCYKEDASYGRGAGRSPCTGCSSCTGCSWGGCSGCSGCSDCSTSHCASSEDVYGALCYPKCRDGYSAFECCLCNLDCQSEGFEGGVAPSCTKHIHISPNMTYADCAEGEEMDAGLCYKVCQDGYVGVGPVCWKKPPVIDGDEWVECGMGAAPSSTVCANVVKDQVISVGEVVLFFASLGSSVAGTTAYKASKAALTVGEVAATAAIEIIEEAGGIQESTDTLIGIGTSLEKAVANVPIVGKSSTLFQSLEDLENSESDIDTIRACADMVSVLDPTGVSSVVAAYTYPMCSEYEDDMLAEALADVKNEATDDEYEWGFATEYNELREELSEGFYDGSIIETVNALSAYFSADDIHEITIVEEVASELDLETLDLEVPDLTALTIPDAPSS